MAPITLISLPPELLSQVVTSLDHAASVRALSLTCKELRTFVEQDGWHAFVLSHFPTYIGPPLWRDAAHSLTSLSRSWNRRALNARWAHPDKGIKIRCVQRQPSGEVNGHDIVAQTDHRARSANARPLQRDRHRQQGRQTMGYHPVIDCIEHRTGGEWTARQETLAIGAGAEVLVRTRSMRNSLESDFDKINMHDGASIQGEHGHKLTWTSWKESHYTDGKDDVSTLNLHQPHDDQDTAHEMVVGRVNGILERITIKNSVFIRASYQTQNRPVRSVDISSEDRPILATCLGRTDIALYELHSEGPTVLSLAEFSALCKGRTARTWCTRFLSPMHLAIGHGTSSTPLDIYQVRPDGVDEGPLRRFPAVREAIYSSQPTSPGSTLNDAVYAIATLPPGSRAGGGEGNVFMSGWYSGSIRLHDLRAPSPFVTSFADPLEAGTAVYSVLPVGAGDTVLAGTALHAKILIFDLRAPGVARSNYRPLEIMTDSPNGVSREHWTSNREQDKDQKSGYNIFLAHESKNQQRESSVYALTSAGPCAPTVYAGLEGSVMQLDVFESDDKLPDPIFRSASAGAPRAAKQRRAREYTSLAMVDWNPMRQGLYVQDRFGSNRRNGIWDSRWSQLR